MKGNDIKRDSGAAAGLLAAAKQESEAEEHPSVRFIRRKIRPLNLKVRESCIPRVNVLIGIIDFKYFFGGYISVFNLARRLALEGYPVRIIITEECYFEPMGWRRKIQDYEGLEDFFDVVEVVYAPDRREAIECHPTDALVATSCWSAHIAHQTMDLLEGDRFIYLSQEYEPIFYELGSLYVLSRMSYDLPHYALFSTEILRDYHRRNRIGLFSGSREEGEARSVSFENAILKFDVNGEALKDRRTRRLVFYARPETHAARNCFELGMLALSGAVEGGHFGERWEFFGIGALQSSGSIRLDGKGPALRLLPKMSLNEYRDLLPHFDVGLSLMLSPHTSLVPIEMAAAGLRVVTNTFENKTAEVLEGISGNLIPAAPTVEGIRDALARAAEGAEDWEARVQGARVKWSQDWDQSFHAGFMDRVKGFIGWEPPERPAAKAAKGAASAGGPDLEPPEVVRSLVRLVVSRPEAFAYRVSREDEMFLDSLGHVSEEEALWWYFKSGIMSLETVRKVVAAAGRSLGEVESFLDFACGYGRVTRFLVQELEPGKIWVSDIYEDAVRFQKRHFGVNGFFSRAKPADVDVPRSFEIIYVGSLFSHLPAARFEEWLIRLYGLLEDDGILIFSTHNERAALEEARLAENGFTYLHFSESRSLSREEYGSTYVRKDWAESLAGRLGMTNLYYLEEELCEQQDVYVVSKQYIPGLNTLTPTVRPVGSIDALTIAEDQRLFLRGWAADRRIGGPVKEVRVCCEGRDLGRATLGLKRPDVRDHFKRDEFLLSGWEYHGPPPVLESRDLSLREGIIVKVIGWGGETGYLNAMSFW